MPALGAATVFPLPPDGNTAIAVTRTWLTDVLVAADGTETRLATRDQPVREMAFTAVFGDARDAGAFRALWYAAVQPLRFLVPLWRELSTPTAIAGSTITTDTTLRRFVNGGQAILWQDNGVEISWEVVDIAALADGSITTVDAVTGDFIIGAVFCLPLMTAWLAPPTIDERGYSEHVPLVFTEELPDVAGIDDAVTGVVTPVVSTAVIYSVDGANEYPERQHTLVLVAKDAEGVVIIDPTAVWALDVSDPDLILVPSLNKRAARVTVLPGAPSGKHATATVGGVTATIQVT